MAWGEWRRARQPQAKRLLLAMVGITVVSLGYLVAALATQARGIELAVLLPLYERFANTVSIGFLAWAFAPSAKLKTRFWDLALIANLVLAIGALAVSIMLWQRVLTGIPTLNLNSHWLSAIWSAWQIVLILLTVFGVVKNREEGWGTITVAMVVMLAGQILQILLSQLTAGAHLPTWIRLANLIAYPLIAIAVYRRTVSGLRDHSLQLQNISQASLDQIKSLLQLSEASRRMSSTLDLPTVLDSAVEGVARALDADLCAIALLLQEDPGTMRLAAIHNLKHQRRGESITFPIEYQSAIQQALRRKQHVIVEQSDDVQVRALYGLLGSSETGPLLIQPLHSGAAPIGAIIVGNTRSNRPFTHHEAKLCQSIAVQLENAIQNARRYQVAQESLQQFRMDQSEEHRSLQNALAHLHELTDQMTSSEAESETLREARNDLESKLLTSRSEVDTLTKRLAAMETDLARQQAEWQGTLQAMLPGMAAGVLVTDAHGVIRASNMAAEILLGRGGEELHGLELKAISTDTEWQEAVATAHGGEAVHLGMQIAHNTLTCDVAPLPQPGTDQSSMQGLVVILQSITPEAQAEQARLETIASMAEELRTPMSTVIGYADLLLSEAMGGVAGVQRKFLLRIKADAERMIQVVNDLAREAGGEDQWSHPQRQTLHLNDEIEGAIALARSQFDIKALSTVVDLANDLPAIEADPVYLQRILTGLLSNACMASPVGGRVQVQSRRSAGPPSNSPLAQDTPGFITVSIMDQGGGLTDAAVSQVFERTRPSQTPPGLGESGAGLALVKALAEAHGGHLWVNSEVGVSTTFSLALPIDKPGEQNSSGRVTNEVDRSAPADVVAG
jgi:signal transduction histidine kinase